MTTIEIYTVQISKWRKVKQLDIVFYDTTVKTGIKAFAPTWPLVLKYKADSISFEEYTESYLELLRASWVNERETWMKLLSHPKIALACYCKPGDNCHRHILKEAVRKLHERYGNTVVDMGEIE